MSDESRPKAAPETPAKVSATTVPPTADSGAAARPPTAEVAAHMALGQPPVCDHRRSPGVSIYAAWDRRVLCQACSRASTAIRDAAADRTCDACGTVVPAGVWTRIAPVGPLLVVFGLCSACARAEGTA